MGMGRVGSGWGRLACWTAIAGLVSVAADPSVWARCQISADIYCTVYSEKSFRLQLNFSDHFAQSSVHWDHV